MHHGPPCLEIAEMNSILMNNLWFNIHDFVYVIKTIMGVSSITWAYLYFKVFIASLLTNLLNLTVINMSYECIKLLHGGLHKIT